MKLPLKHSLKNSSAMDYLYGQSKDASSIQFSKGPDFGEKKKIIVPKIWSFLAKNWQILNGYAVNPVDWVITSLLKLVWNYIRFV